MRTRPKPGSVVAAEAGHEVVVLHAWDATDGQSTYHAPAALRGSHERGLAEAVAGYAEKYPDVPVERRLCEGRAVPSLLEAASFAEQVVVGSRGRHGVAAWIGSVSRAVAEHADCPVTVVPSGRRQLQVNGKVA